MKKYFLGAFALVLAVGFSSFGVISKKATTTFHYVAPASNPFSQANVQNVSNWQEGSLTCSGIADKACIIVVDDQNLDGFRNLDASKVTINANDLNVNGQYMVQSLTLSVSAGSSITNKQ